MAVNQISTNPSIVELMLKAKAQPGQEQDRAQARQSTAAVKETDQGQTTAGNEGVKVSITAQSKTENSAVKANTPDNSEQQTQEPQNSQAKSAIQAYRNANAAVENGNQKPEDQKQKQMSRITG